MSDSDVLLMQRLQAEANEILDRRTRLARSNIARLKAFKAASPPPPRSAPQSDCNPVPLTVSLLDLPAPKISRIV
jgi:hypothetical protein